MLRFIQLFSLLTIAAGIQAQNGTVTGVLINQQSGEPLIGATVRVEGQPGGAFSQDKGRYTLHITPGIHNITIDYIGLPQHIEKSIVVNPGKTTVHNISLGGEIEQAIKGSDIVVTATRKRNTEAAILLDRKNDVKISDGVGGVAMKKAGDGDAGAAVSRVTGISVQGGKHVLVRGLGDRYTKTILNGMVIPGLDPDRNSVQMDIFPTNVLDNIKVYKSLTPDLPADFAGGLVDIATLSFPSRKYRSFSFGIGYNPHMNLQSDFLTYEGGKTDWLGFDDGTRALPVDKNMDLTQKEYDPAWNNPELTHLTQRFSKVLAPKTKISFLNTNLSYSQGNHKTKDKHTLAYNLAINHSIQSTYYRNAIFGTYIKSQDPDQKELLHDRSTRGPLGKTEAAWSALGGFAIQNNQANKRNKVSFTLFHTQNAESRAGQTRQEDLRENPYIMYRNNLEFTQRSVTNFMVLGRHKRDSGRWDINWSLSPTVSIIDEPDIRLTAFEYTDDVVPRYALNQQVGAIASRTYRYLLEYNYNVKFDAEREFTMRNESITKLKFGALETFKLRDFSVLDYRFRVKGSNFYFSGNANELLQDHYIWTPSINGAEDTGVYVSGQPQQANTYRAMQNVAAAYILNELPINVRLKATYGVRMEQARNYYTGQNQNRERMNDSMLLNETTFLPSVNLVYALTKGRTRSEGTNLRFSYNRTLARPSFKELSNAQIVDRISGRTFLGNDSLVQTNIDNLDIRWERFMNRSQVVSISGFYKQFQKPIELVAYSAANPNDFQPRNVGTATLYGVEMEAILMVNQLSTDSSATSFGANVTLVKSRVEMTEGERLGRVSAARNGEVVGNTRDMVGASPYIINAFVNYIDKKRGFSFNLSYNVQGQRLSIVGVARNPDVYEMPFHSLNFKARMKFGKNDDWGGSVSVKNMLASDRVLEYVSFGAENKLFSQLEPMRTLSVSISYSL